MCESYIGATEKSVARIRVSQAGQFIRSMFWIGCIGFGGGSALIPVIEKEIADRQGIDEKQNIDKDVVVASITPGALPDRKSTRLNSSHWNKSRMPSSA